MPGVTGYLGSGAAGHELLSDAVRKLKRRDWIQAETSETNFGPIALVGVPTLFARSPRAEDRELGIHALLCGYLSNRAELCKRFRLPTAISDSQIVLEVYKRQGTHCFETLDGCYHGVITDQRCAGAILFTDRFGSIPVFYHYGKQSGIFSFGPELKVFRDCRWIDRRPDWRGICEYFSFGQPWDDRTLLDQVKILTAGHFVRWSPDGVAAQRYWDVPYKRHIAADISGDTLAANLDAVLETAHSCISTMPGRKGLFLSGGRDSRLIACYLKRCNADFTALGMHFEDKPALDSIVSPRVAQGLGVPWEKISYRLDNAAELLDEHLLIHDGTWQCSYLPNALPNSELRDRFSMIVNGNNGNQLFGDYATVFQQRIIRTLDGKIPVEAFQQLGADGLMAQLTFDALSGYRNTVRPVLTDGFMAQVDQTALRTFSNAYDVRQDIVGPEKYEYLALTQTSRRWGVFNFPNQDYFEGVNPFYDNKRVIEFTTSLPLSWKLYRLLDQHNLFRRFPEVSSLPMISGYPVMLDYHQKLYEPGTAVDDYYDAKYLFRHVIPHAIEERINDPRFLRREWIKPDAVRAGWEAHKNGALDFAPQIAALISIDYFFKAFID